MSWRKDVDAAELHVELPGGTFRKATTKEVEDAKAAREKRAALTKKFDELQAQINEIDSACDHKVFYDEPGHTYSVRTCFKCGHSTVF